jgi:multicomponent Na+:H+ antiporter subunit D
MFESLFAVIAGVAAYLLLRKFLRPLPVYFERIDSALSSYLVLFLISIVLAIILSS